jgi:hypothetical protein
LYSLVISRQITGYSVLEHCMAAVWKVTPLRVD